MSAQDRERFLLQAVHGPGAYTEELSDRGLWLRRAGDAIQKAEHEPLPGGKLPQPSAQAHDFDKDTNTSANCIWDAPKLALMVRLKRAASGHLIAAAPTALWTPKTAGLELFFDREWDMLDLRERHPSWWQKWEKEKLMPLRIPARLKTIEGARLPFICNGVQWTLGLARVEPLGEEWLQWPRFFPERWGAPTAEPQAGTGR